MVVEEARPAGRNGAAHSVAESPDGQVLAAIARSRDGVFAVDSRQRVVFWSASAEELLGRRAGDVLGTPCYQAFLGRDAPDHVLCRTNCPTIRAARSGRGVPSFDVDVRRGDGYITLNVSSVPLPEREGGGPVAVHLFRDVSARPREAPAGDAGPVAPENGSPPAPYQALTPREVEVLALLGEGLTTEQLAARLTLSRTTVRNHIQHVLAKLGAHSRLEAVLRGVRMGLI
jgi:PAS domain S-box-containing protein